MRSRSSGINGEVAEILAALKLLVVEDNKGYLKLFDEIKERLDKVQFEIESADTLAAAIDKARHGGFDAVLLDLGLPDSKGLETLTRFQKGSPGIPVIVLTSLRDEETAIEAVRHGAQDYLVKGPLDARTLVNAILASIERGEEIQRDAKKVELLIFRRKLSTLLMSYPEDKMYSHVLRFLMASSRSRLGMFGYMLGSERLYMIRAVAKDDQGEPSAMEGPMEIAREDWKGVWGEALTERRIASAEGPVEIPGLEAPVRGCMAVPIVDQGALVGIFVLADKPASLGAEDRAKLEVAAELVGPILNSRRLRDERTTERRGMEVKLRDQEEYLANIVSAENIILLGLDRNGVIKLFNEGAERVTGYSKRDALDKRAVSLLVSDGKMGKGRSEYERLITGGGTSVIEFEAPVLTRSGETRIISWYGRKVMVRGEELGFTVLGVDITGRRMAEASLVKRIEDVEDARVRARAYFDFLAHDIANLLSPVMSYAELISMDAETSESSKKKAGKITDQVRRASSFILSLRRLDDAELISLERTETRDLGEILNEAVDTVKEEYEDKHITATVITPAEQINFLGGRHLGNIIVGILENSAGAAERDALALEVKATLVKEDGRMFLKLELTDDGPGISDELKESFVVSSDPRKRFAVGVSRGVASPLLISSAIVSHIGGQLWVEDRIPGDFSKGSRIVMKFPKEGFFGT